MRKIFLLFLVFQLLHPFAKAQDNYPIFVTTSLTPPYSLNLSDYSKFGSQKLMVTIHVNDLNISNLPIKLRIKMETMGVTIENPPTINTTPIFIDGGTTSILFGNDLTDYFNINNLIFKGYSKEAYSRTGQLPEGFYKITVEVLHFNSNRLISNQGTATAWINIGKPPILKLPENNAQMGEFKGMPLTFSWLSSNVGSPVSANTIQYKFEMWEMRVPGINPNTVAASIPVFHEYTSFNTIYSLYPVSLLMEPGMQYAWRVTASDLSGFVPFEQNGQSEIRIFTYKALCDSVTGFSSSLRGQSGAFSWQPGENHTSFNVEMRKPETNWFLNSQSYENKAEFFDLDFGATYQMRVQAVCDGDPDSKSDFSDWQSLTVPAQKPLIDTVSCANCACDDQVPDVELQNFELREDLQVGDTIINKTGTTRFILKTVEPQGNGTYKGIFLFWAEIWNLKFICNYWDLQVNTDDVIVNMDFESVYDPQFMIDVDATIDYLNNLGNAVTVLTSDTQIKDTIVVNETITSIYVNDDNAVIAVTVDENGDIQEVVINNNADDIEKTLIQGANGEEFVINRDGEVMGVDEYKNTGGGRESLVDNYNEEKEANKLSDNLTVNFSANEKQQYGFDRYDEHKIALQNTYPALNNGYRPAYKSVASFSTDIVDVSNSGNNITFKDEMGIPALLSEKQLTLRGSANGADVALYAYQAVNDTTEKIAGKLNILSFDEQARRLFIVPVNGSACPEAFDLQETLNKIYSQAVTHWTVEKLPNLSDIVFENGNMTHGGTSAMAVYNNDQRTIVNSFEDVNGKMEGDACYLFFVDNVQFKERSIAGYMPLQRQVGFIYDNPGLNTVAHELGHGAFNLFHTFSTENFIATEHSTQNLMDYAGGTEFWKHQWDLIHDPQNMLFAWAQDEEEGEMDESSNANLTYWLKHCKQYIGVGPECIKEPLKKDEVYAVKQNMEVNNENYELKFVSVEAKRTDFSLGKNYSPVDVSGKWKVNETEIVKGDEIEGVTFILKEVSKKKNRKIEIYPTKAGIFKLDFFTDKANVKNPINSTTIEILAGTIAGQKTYKIRNNTTQAIEDNYSMKEKETIELEIVEEKNGEYISVSEDVNWKEKIDETFTEISSTNKLSYTPQTPGTKTIEINTGDNKIQLQIFVEPDIAECGQSTAYYIDDKGEILYSRSGSKTYLLKTYKNQNKIYGIEYINAGKAAPVNNEITKTQYDNVLQYMKQLRKNNKNDAIIPPEIQMHFIEIECVSVLKEMHQIVSTNLGACGNPHDDGKGGPSVNDFGKPKSPHNNIEYGGTVDFYGNVIEAVHNTEPSNPKTDENAYINISKGLTTRSSFHSHPSGELVEIIYELDAKGNKIMGLDGQYKSEKHKYSFVQAPSSIDVQNFSLEQYGYVFAMGDKDDGGERVYVYNAIGVIGFFSSKLFKNSDFN